MKRAYKS